MLTSLVSLLPVAVQPYAKALVAAVTAGLAAYGTAQSDGVTGQEWVAVAIAALTAGGFVYGTPNIEQAPPVDPPVEPGPPSLDALGEVG
ncbi:hypothetical protein GCM10027053_52120 [Intrasporangium mesophilum]